MKSELAGNAVLMQVPDAEYATGFLWQRHGSRLQSLPLALRTEHSELFHRSRWSVLWGVGGFGFVWGFFEPEWYSVLLLLFAKWFFKRPVSALLYFNITIQKLFNTLIFGRMFHYTERKDLQKEAGLILCGDIKKIYLNIQFVHKSLKKKKKSSQVFSNPQVSVDWGKSRSS